MNEQISHEPIQEGVQHGPYLPEGNTDPYQYQLNKHFDAIEDAVVRGNISRTAYWEQKNSINAALGELPTERGRLQGPHQIP